MNSRYKIIECKRGESFRKSFKFKSIKKLYGFNTIGDQVRLKFTPARIRIRLPGLIWRTQLKLGNASNQRTVEYCLESNDRICNFGLSDISTV